MRHTTKTYHFTLASMGLLALFAVSLYFITQAAQKPQELRQKATVPNGPAQILLSPDTAEFTVGAQSEIQLAVSIPSLIVDGFQIVASISGTLPSTIQFIPATMMNVSVISNQLIQMDDTLQLRLAFLSTNPLTPITSSTIMSLGTLVFTPSVPGAMTMTFDHRNTVIAQNQTTLDIANELQAYSYSFTVVPTTTPSPTVTMTPTQTLTPTHSLTPTPSPITWCKGPDNTVCNYTICPTCTTKICPKLPCKIYTGICVNNNCQIGKTIPIPSVSTPIE